MTRIRFDGRSRQAPSQPGPSRAPVRNHLHGTRWRGTRTYASTRRPNIS